MKSFLKWLAIFEFITVIISISLNCPFNRLPQVMAIVFIAILLSFIITFTAQVWRSLEDTEKKVKKTRGMPRMENPPPPPKIVIPVTGWISVNDLLPEPLETVWISNGKGWTTLGCRSDYHKGDNDELNWCWAGAIYGGISEEDGKIIAESEEDDLDVRFWHKVPIPLNC